MAPKVTDDKISSLGFYKYINVENYTVLEEAVNWIYIVCRGSSTEDPYSTISGGWKTDLNFKINKKREKKKISRKQIIIAIL